MRLSNAFSVWKKERTGLTMIVASLIVITVTVGLLFSYQQQSEEAHIRKQGVSLARVLSRLPYEQLVPESGQQGVLSLLQYGLDNSAFAYLAVVSAAGEPLTEISSPGVIIPDAPLPTTPTTWLGERTLSLANSGQSVSEFHAPLFDRGQIAGHIRLGYLMPGIGIESSEIPFFATLALPIFLLTPLFYFLLKHEIRPLHTINSQLDSMMARDNLPKFELAATGELREFMSRFSLFIDKAHERIQSLEHDRTGLETSAKLLSYKRSRIEAVIQSLPDAIMVLDETGTTSFANARFSTLIGVPPMDIINRRPVEWCNDEEVVAFLAGCGNRAGRGFTSDSHEYSPASSPGKIIAITPYPLYSPKQPTHTLGTLVLFRDITAEHMASKSGGEFIAQVAHELKAPLNIISIYSETLQSDQGASDEFRIEAGNVIKDETERLALLINNILNISKIESGSISIDRKRVKLKDLLQDTFDACTRSGRAGDLKFSLDIPKEISPVAADKDLLRIAINNLLTNAIKYNNPGGTVELTADETETTVRISVKDTGVGINATDMDKIFDKFYRSENDVIRQRTGHGLGLSLAREIIQLHHGTLTVNSTPGQGSEFMVEFSKETDLLKQAV